MVVWVDYQCDRRLMTAVKVKSVAAVYGLAWVVTLAYIGILNAKLGRMERHWGTPEGISLAMWSPSVAHDRHAADSMASYFRAAASPGAALAVMRMNREIDVRHVLPFAESGAVKVLVHSTYPLDKAADAYDAFAAGGKLGKIVIEP